MRKSGFLYSRRDLNPHGQNAHRILSPACLPIPPLEHSRQDGRATIVLSNFCGLASEKRDSNPRPRPWQGRALPTELFSLKNLIFPDVFGVTKIVIFFILKNFLIKIQLKRFTILVYINVSLRFKT